MTTTPRLGITQLEEDQALPEAVANEADLILEQMASMAIVKDKDLATPPGSPAEGDAYIVAASATGAWTGWEGRIAFYASGWIDITPIEGTEAYVQDENVKYSYSGSAWAASSAGVTVEDEGSSEGTGITTLNFTGSGVSVTVTGAEAEIIVPGAGAGAAWALVGAGQTATGIWDFAVDGAKANVDFTSLSAYNELLLIIDAVTGSAGTANRTIRVSTDNGSTFYSTSGDYVQLSAAGTVTNTGACTFLSSATAAASTVSAHIRNTKGAVKSITSTAPGTFLFRASASDINAVRITTTTADTLNGGKIYVYGR